VQIAVAEELRDVTRLGVLAFENVHVVEHEPRLDARLAQAADAARVHPPPESAAVRTMYRRIGLDPTKTRPSSEALLRRVRKGDGLPRINSAVDICNWCSLEFQLPYGLYDLSAIDTPVALRLGTAGEKYAGIRKDAVHVENRLTLADAMGPFGNPTSDSARTMVTPETTRLLMVVFAPSGTEPARLARVLQTSSERIQEFCGATEAFRGVV
jgi:DNA/RNA-binding domain of Phe-tRNA-synthetase-like protein